MKPKKPKPAFTLEEGQEFNPYNIFVGSFIPNWLMKRSEISPGAKLCYARLCQYAGENGECFPKQATLCEELGTSERQVKRYIKELEEIGLISVIQQGLNRPNIYRFVYHKWMDASIIKDRTYMAQPEVPEMSLQKVPEMSHPEVSEMSCQERQDTALPINIEENQFKRTNSRESTKTTEAAAVDISENLIHILPSALQTKAITALIQKHVKAGQSGDYIRDQITYCLDRRKSSNPNSFRAFLGKALDNNYGAGCWADKQEAEKLSAANRERERQEAARTLARMEKEQQEAKQADNDRIESMLMQWKAITPKQREAIISEFRQGLNIISKKRFKPAVIESPETAFEAYLQSQFSEFLSLKVNL